MTGDIAILHDQLVNHGGAEHVAYEMARTLDAPIYAAVVDEDTVPDDIDARSIVDSWVGERAMHSHYLLQDVYQMLRWQHVEDLYEFDTLVINKTNPAWFVPKDTQTTVWYAHSTPRGQNDLFWRDGGHWLSRLIKTPMRPLYQPNVNRADAWACNSELVQRRLDRYWDVPPGDVEVIYPPVDVESYGPEQGDDADYYFTFSRLHDHKRVDEIVRAFNQLNRSGAEYNLVVGGDGPERDDLEAMAGPNVEFVGYMSEEEKRRRLAECKAFVFAAQNEDFGMVPIEAMASGTPVLGVQEGFTKHQIVERKNGYTWAREGGHLRETIRLFERKGVEWDAGRIQSFADQFGASRFREELRALVSRAEERSTVTAPWEEAEIEVEDPARLTIDGGEV